MIVSIARFGSRHALAAAVFAGVIVTGSIGAASAGVKEVTLKELESMSDRIVVAIVTKIEDVPGHPQREDDRMPPPKVATARVVETLKGKPVDEVRFGASPTWFCDISSAKKGERVVLFLITQEEAPALIARFGRGRLPMRDVKGKAYAALPSDVILPKGTPTISETETVKLTLPSREPGKPPVPVTVEFQVTVTSIELGELRKLAKSMSAEEPRKK